MATLLVFGTLADKADASHRGEPRTSTNASTRLSDHSQRELQECQPEFSSHTLELLRICKKIRNPLTVGYGEEHIRKRGTPQGCPFSMTLIPLLVRPWVLQVLRAGTTPRVLADDLHVVAQKIQSESEPHCKPTPSQMLQSFCQGCCGPPTLGLASYVSTGTSSLNPSTVLTETRSDFTRRYGTMSSAINNSTWMELIIATHAPRPITMAIEQSGGRQTEGASQATGLIVLMGACGFSGKGSYTIHVKWIPGHQTQQDEDNTSWLGTRVRTTTKVWPSMSRRRSRGTTNIESWYWIHKHML